MRRVGLFTVQTQPPLLDAPFVGLTLMQEGSVGQSRPSPGFRSLPWLDRNAPLYEVRGKCRVPPRLCRVPPTFLVLRGPPLCQTASCRNEKKGSPFLWGGCSPLPGSDKGTSGWVSAPLNPSTTHSEYSSPGSLTDTEQALELAAPRFKSHRPERLSIQPSSHSSEEARQAPQRPEFTGFFFFLGASWDCGYVLGRRVSNTMGPLEPLHI